MVVQLDHGRHILRTTCVKPWVRQILLAINTPKCSQPTIENDTQECMVTVDDHADNIDLGSTTRKVQVKSGSIEEKAFLQPRRSQLQGLMDEGTFVQIHMSQNDKNHLIFGSRFVDELQNIGDGLLRNSRLVAQNYADDDATAVGTKDSTVQRFSQRVVLSIGSSIISMIRTGIENSRTA